MSDQKKAQISRKSRKPTPPVIKYYLVAYNVLSTLGWGSILVLALIHIFNVDARSSKIAAPRTQTASDILTRLTSSMPLIRSSGYTNSALDKITIPLYLQEVYHHATTTYARVGVLTAFVQTFAILEVFHSLLGWVRSPVGTTLMQVGSRLSLVWLIAEQFENPRTHPCYASMVLAWSLTEVIRYPFYAFNLLQHEPHSLLYLRYSTFYILYPVGAISEAVLIYSTLPRSSPIPSWSSWIQGMWKPADYGRALMFVVWWPSLYMLYTYMMTQRRKVLGGQSRDRASQPRPKTQ